MGEISICQFYSPPQYQLVIFQVMKCYVNPVISIIGFSANMFGVAILRRSGLGKPSNILLLGLVVADSMCQLTTMNFAEILELLGPNMAYPKLCGWQYGPGLNYFLLACDVVIIFLGSWGQSVHAALPVLITVERFLAVYTPLTFKQIVTRRATSVIVALTFLAWLPWVGVYMSMARVTVQLSKVMFFDWSSFSIDDATPFTIFYYYVSDILSNWFPTAFVVVGCVVIWARVKITMSQRKKLTSGSCEVKWSNRTTRTLLTTCCIFSVTHVIFSLANYFTGSVSEMESLIMMEFMNLVYLINASSNFFVYITSNSKLLLIFKQIIGLVN
ncbi:hypothetical protein Btru_047126 [Bulinus truncatus]|nr:hypothetical protein Btru_047126 [Bulinus truncatus]